MDFWNRWFCFTAEAFIRIFIYIVDFFVLEWMYLIGLYDELELVRLAFSLTKEDGKLWN